ncbi:exosortase [Labrenzia sp. C1B10]|uniref:exosortase T n=1 Tax=unclassified Labrenzia TaxID=2648686 RepID=UPI0003B8857F|nr:MULTISPECIES: exosortase T [unclassified Labrenzia]ERP94104.1 exosortase [Labrenzia sp. C1B10]ERS05069.1 exosortase [Labrenzia sp. C1B70]
MTRLATSSPTSLAFLLASLILAYEPLRWLVGTWTDPSYPSTGALYLIAVAALVLWSMTSPVRQNSIGHRQMAVLLLLGAALIRLASQVLAINVIGGLALAIDVFALATLLRTGERQRAVSPFWLSVLFLFTLPVERILQRLIGYPLQELSAKLSCGGLGLFFSDLSCSGIRIGLAGKDVLVDLPCSGTSGLMLAMAFLVILTALYRPNLLTAVLWIGITLGLALIGNSLRIALLAVGIAYPESVLEADAMAQPLHDFIGYLTLLLSMAPVLAFYKPRPAEWRAAQAVFSLPVMSRPLQKMSALVFLSLALFIVSLPRHALDVSSSTRPQPLPLTLAGEVGVDEALLPIEEQYFLQYGGHAQKRRYGPMALTLVHTSSPLRHLHAPDDCLRGLGFDVTFLGSRFEPVPTALYRARSKTGGDWRVAVTFTSSTGETTHNIAEAIWLWLKRPGTIWTSIQRITPWTLDEPQRAAFEAAAGAALDLNTRTSGIFPAQKEKRI